MKIESDIHSLICGECRTEFVNRSMTNDQLFDLFREHMIEFHDLSIVNQEKEKRAQMLN